MNWVDSTDAGHKEISLCSRNATEFHNYRAGSENLGFFLATVST